MIKIQEISTFSCSHCASAKEILEEEIRPNFPDVKIEYIDMFSDRGQKMVAKYGVMSLPGIIINNELFSVGGLNKTKLIKKIKSLA